MTLNIAEVSEHGEDYIVVDIQSAELKSDFQKDGVPAKWAAGFPKTWGSEEKKLDYAGNPIGAASVSHDEKLLAVAVGQGVQILETESFTVLDTLHGTLPVQRALFQPKESEDGGYLLFTHALDYWEGKYLIICWHLDKNGKRPEIVSSHEEHQVATQFAASGAMDFLKDHAGWRSGEPALKSVGRSIESEVSRIIKDAEKQRLFAQDQDFSGTLTTFDRSVFSHDGKRLLYLKEKAPYHQIIVRDIASGKDLSVMERHTESVMSVVFSPDDRLIASAGWDQLLIVWDAGTGKRLRTFPATGGQNWVAAFSPDSKHVVVSAGPPRAKSSLIMWEFHDPQAFPKQLGEFPGWARTVQWNPEGSMLAAGSFGGKLIVFEPHRNAVAQTWETKDGATEISDVTWLQDGQKLAFKPGDGGLELYDFEKNLKWRWGPGAHDKWRHGFWVDTIVQLKKKGWIGSIDQDGILRFWEMPK